MTQDDPFGLENDAGRTRIRPVSQARRPAPPPDANPEDVTARLRQPRAGDNPLISAFSVPLGLAPELERATPPDSPDVLRARLLDNLTYARDTAVADGVPLARADQAAWLVAALLDDIALNTPWGGSSGWPRQPLVVSLSGNVDAGERFYDRLDELMRYPDRDRDMLELAFICLSLGFRGKHRVSGASGDASITQLRGQIARLLHHPDADDTPLSPHWQGVLADDEPPRFALPLWSIGVLAVAVLTLIYVGLGIRLTGKGEQLYALSNLLPPPERAGIFRPVVETAEPLPELKVEPVVLEFLPLVAQSAPPDALGALSGRETVSLAVVVVQGTNPEVFRSAKADINDAYSPLIASIARVITDNIEFVGGVTVVGHTDSIPVQRSNPFASNQGLSEARAETIKSLLEAAGVPGDILGSEGRAASEPIGDNGTREGRARNRRVEIVIEKRV